MDPSLGGDNPGANGRLAQRFQTTSSRQALPHSSILEDTCSSFNSTSLWSSLADYDTNTPTIPRTRDKLRKASSQLCVDNAVIQRSEDGTKNNSCTTGVAVSDSNKTTMKSDAELLHITAQLEAVTEERDEAKEGMEDMLSDLINAEEEIKSKEEDITRLRIELGIFKQQIKELSSDLATERQQSTRQDILVAKLKNEAARSDHTQQQTENLLIERSSSNQAKDTELLHLQQQIIELAAAVEDRENKLNQTNAALNWLAEDSQSKVEQVGAQTTAHERNRQEETRLLESQTSLRAQIEELRRVSNFYKSNSERLSRETTELRSVNKALLQELEVKDKDLDEAASLIHELRSQGNAFQGKNA